jgi:hypothetical protein
MDGSSAPRDKLDAETPKLSGCRHTSRLRRQKLTGCLEEIGLGVPDVNANLDLEIFSIWLGFFPNDLTAI